MCSVPVCASKCVVLLCSSINGSATRFYCAVLCARFCCVVLREKRWVASQRLVTSQRLATSPSLRLPETPLCSSVCTVLLWCGSLCVVLYVHFCCGVQRRRSVCKEMRGEPAPGNSACVSPWKRVLSMVQSVQRSGEARVQAPGQSEGRQRERDTTGNTLQGSRL